MEPAFNRLIYEKSPYLRQHARNPVDWYPWGDEAFSRARDDDKPVLLSVGYSTCHWCHVMAHESFEDDETARLLNRVFICVKVDREERPDIDTLYMTACQMLTGGGGWPLTVIMTPDKKPFFTGTYFPRESRNGHIGIKDLALRLDELWKDSRGEINALSAEVIEAINLPPAAASRREPGIYLADNAYALLGRRHDSTHGGFSAAPKFPMPHTLMFLMRYRRARSRPEALSMVVSTLDGMMHGGIYDHIGGGFHRYSTDGLWLVPHFEKMLYDQALLSMAYTEAFQITRNEEYKSVVDETLGYVLREMTSPDGMFYSAEDADSEGREGAFYLWSWNELYAVLGADDLDFFSEHYGVMKEGNFTDEATGQRRDTNIIHRKRRSSYSETYADDTSTRCRLKYLREKLRIVREQRVRPHRDEKILTDRNGLMIAALAMAGRALGNPLYTLGAQKAAEFILATLKNDDDVLTHSYRGRNAGTGGFLDDYAFLSWGLLELYYSVFDTRYLKAAAGCTLKMIDLFRDGSSGVFTLSPSAGGDLPARVFDTADGALPSGNSVALMNLLRLGRLTGDETMTGAAETLLGASTERLERNPSAHTFLLSGLIHAVHGGSELVFVSPGADRRYSSLVNEAHRAYLPDAIMVLVDEGNREEVDALTGFTRPYGCVDGKPTAYVCRNRACGIPLTDAGELSKALDT